MQPCAGVKRVEVVTFVLNFLLKSPILFCRKFAGNHIVQTQLMNDLLVGIRVSMTLVQKVPSPEGYLWSDSSNCLIWRIMCGLLSIFTDFLNDGKCDKMMIITACQSV